MHVRKAQITRVRKKANHYICKATTQRLYILSRKGVKQAQLLACTFVSHSDRHPDTALMILEWNIRAFKGTYSTITAVSSDIVSPSHAVINNSVLVIKIFCLIVKTNLSGSLRFALLWKEKKQHFWFSLDKGMVENIQKWLRFFNVPSLNIVRICSSKKLKQHKRNKIVVA